MIPSLRIGSLLPQRPLTAQHLSVAVSGSEVQRIRPQIDIRALPDPEEQRVDPVALLAASAVHGLFSGSAGVAGHISAYAERNADARPDVAFWSLFLDGVDLSALRLLANMLAYRSFDSAEIVADGCTGGVVTRGDMLSYPSCSTPQEFAFEYERPLKSRGERGVRLGFVHEPDDATLDRVIASLDAWGNILMAGAYSSDPAAGVFANQATLEEPCVVGVSLPVCSGTDEIMFSPVINLARRIHALYAPLEWLEIV